MKKVVRITIFAVVVLLGLTIMAFGIFCIFASGQDPENAPLSAVIGFGVFMFGLFVVQGGGDQLFGHKQMPKKSG